MDKSHLERKVGFFIGLGLVLLAGMLIYFSKGASLFHGTYLLKLHATNVGGLKEQSFVQLAGVNVGNVHQIKLDPSGTNVTIELQIYKQFPIYHDARFVIEEAGFLGDHYISVIPTTNNPPVLADGADVLCESPFNLQEVARSAAGFVERLDETAKKIDASVSDLRAQVLNAAVLANFGNTITNLRLVTEQALTTVQDIHNLVGTNRDQVNLVVSNIVFFSAQLNQMGCTASNLLATNGVNLTAATKNIADLTVSAQQLLKDIQAGQGLAGALVQNNQTTTNIQLLAENLSLVSSNLNRFGLWHILWSHPSAATPNAVKPAAASPR
jgi:phospholipid/cholesterol/gamma-HCH transport system substrate-binding protein